MKKMGVTPGCRGCEAVNRGGEPKNHSEECRIRMGTAIAAYDPVRFERALNRYREAQVKRLEREDKKNKTEDRTKEDNVKPKEEEPKREQEQGDKPKEKVRNGNYEERERERRGGRGYRRTGQEKSMGR